MAIFYSSVICQHDALKELASNQTILTSSDRVCALVPYISVCAHTRCFATNRTLPSVQTTPAGYKTNHRKVPQQVRFAVPVVTFAMLLTSSISAERFRGLRRGLARSMLSSLNSLDCTGAHTFSRQLACIVSRCVRLAPI